MSWGFIKFGRLDLREQARVQSVVNAGTNENTINMSGTETNATPPVAVGILRSRREDFLGMIDRLVAVTFSQKAELNGYWVVNDVNTSITDWMSGDGVYAFDWSFILSRQGPDNMVDLESRLTGVARQNVFALAGTRWHAPPIGHYGYFTGSTLPSGSVSRTGEEGAIKVWTGIPAAIDPRWGCAVTDYLKGAVRITQGGVVRAGAGINVAPTGWEVSNTLVRVRPSTSTGLLEISCWDAGVWAPKLWNIARGGTNILPANITAVTVLRNDPEAITLRLIAPQLSGAAGRTLVDLTLRRGARTVDAFIQTDSSTTLTLHLQASETTTDNSASGYVVATSNDTDGNKYVAGSAKAFAVHANGGVSKASTTTLDAFAGIVFNGTGAAAGDAATDLRDQYIGAPAETVVAVNR